MGEKNKKVAECVKDALNFFQNTNSIRALDIIIDIFDEIRYSGINNNDINQKILRILYSLINSDSLDSLLGKEDKRVFALFLEEFLKINCDSGNWCLGNKDFKKLTLDEFYNVLIEVKYLKERELLSRSKLPINE